MVKLIRYDAACKAIAACVRVDEAKKIRDEFEGFRAYAKQAKNKEMEADCVVIKMRATRRIGQLMEAQRTAVGLSTGGRPRTSKRKRRAKTGSMANPVLPSLESQEIDKYLADLARRYSRLTDRKFEDACDEARRMILSLIRRVISLSDITEERAAHAAAARDAAASFRDLQMLIRSGKKFGAIYADPPWEFKAGEKATRTLTRHYPTMGPDEIKALPIWKLAADNCALFMWATWPQMKLAFETIEAWGFEYKTGGFDWIKTNKKNNKTLFWGQGMWTRANSEPCLIATMGSPSRIHADVHQIVMAPVAKHSEKPEEARKRIERLVRGPYLELFGRKLIDGWTVWGNQVEAVTIPNSEDFIVEAAE